MAVEQLVIPHQEPVELLPRGARLLAMQKALIEREYRLEVEEKRRGGRQAHTHPAHVRQVGERSRNTRRVVRYKRAARRRVLEIRRGVGTLRRKKSLCNAFVSLPRARDSS